MGFAIDEDGSRENEMTMSESGEYHKGVKYLCGNGIAKVPAMYILPVSERPDIDPRNINIASNHSINLPIIDFAQLQGTNRSQTIVSLAKACQEYGFFQLINHGIEVDCIDGIRDVSKKFFGLPYEERSKYMSRDMHSPVRYGTSFNQNNDKVFCWRDFLKLSCHPLSEVLPSWPSSPPELRQAVANFSMNTKSLYLKLMEAMLESLGLIETTANGINNGKESSSSSSSSSTMEFEDGSQLIVMNCYPSCPEPELTLGIPPHSDYGFLTLLLQDQQVQGLQIQHQQEWVNVEPLPNSFIVNVGDHLEIFSNGRYKSVLHRVVVNSYKSRISVASLHSLPFDAVVRPSPKLIDISNPRRYKDTDFSNFLHYIASREHNTKNFLDSRKLT
ncbi:probable 2-oxoglutarate-dependent dioxygenase SLC1 [Ziziphus jujuba]|uniref:Probable 2-oxoglutarate-dependent dioxygenase SLC1 n=1 Tax=Ziziphus jujuba TaxID=326968 RepID=A0ABM3IE08_ZIZJJ|nr:probable 2-oxoglutarate-dependent dioxygenase SLC1 [Ziziphus jujuba]XP_048326373.2 probable 2-oxoglutarate-dependent dioxygenase SLC1 [Ziziphus jujuba]